MKGGPASRQYGQGRKEHFVSPYCAPTTFVCRPVPATQGPWRFLVPSAEDEQRLDRSKAFPSQPSFSAKAEHAPRPSARVSSIPSTGRRLRAVPSCGAWGSPHVQNSCVLKHLPSSRLTTRPPVTGSKHSQCETQGLQTGLRHCRGGRRLVKPEARTPRWLRTVRVVSLGPECGF